MQKGNVLTVKVTLLIVEGGVNVNFTPVGMQSPLLTSARKSRPQTASRFPKKCRVEFNGAAKVEVAARITVVAIVNERMTKYRKDEMSQGIKKGVAWE